MAILIRGGEIFAPQPQGPQDILIAGGHIEAITGPGKVTLNGLDVHEIDGTDKIVLPGLIDTHVHILGGGGEGGPTTRAPEITIEDIISSGVTTLFGCLGTDCITRHMTSLLAKARALDVEGVTTFIFSGSYEIPVVTLTGSIRSDLVLIDKVLGAGEIAISDHRSAQPTFEEIARLAAECRVGGMLGGKAGVLHLHVGDGSRGLEFLFRLMRETEIPARQVMPTHINRNRRLLNEGIAFVKAGGYIDLTVGTSVEDESDADVSVETAIRLCLEQAVPLDHITATSDGNGSKPLFDGRGNLAGLTIANERDLLEKFRSLVRRKILTLEQAAQVFSTNPARFYRLKGKGVLESGADADLIVLDRNLHLTEVIARGRIMMEGGSLVARGSFVKH